MHYLSTNPAGPGCIWVIHETRCGQAQASWANGGLTQPQKPSPFQGAMQDGRRAAQSRRGLGPSLRRHGLLVYGLSVCPSVTIPIPIPGRWR